MGAAGLEARLPNERVKLCVNLEIRNVKMQHSFWRTLTETEFINILLGKYLVGQMK
jgi:hypothetical protein